MLSALLLLACRCAPGGPSPPEDPDEIGHYAVMEQVYAAAVAGDRAAVKDRSRRLEGGAIAELAAEEPVLARHLDRLHGAVGFAIAATDQEDVAAAVAVMGRACGECHAASGSPLDVPPAPDDPSQDHAAGAALIWRGYIAGDAAARRAGAARYVRAAEALGAEPAGAAALTGALSGEALSDAVAAWLLSCPTCHAAGPAQGAGSSTVEPGRSRP